MRFERPPWSGDGVPVACVAAPIDGAGGAALVALYDVETATTQEARAAAAAAQSELERLEADLAERDAALDLSDEVARALRAYAGVEAIVASVELVLRRLGAVDVALAPYMAGQVVLGRSARGMLGPDMLTVAAHPDLATAVRDGEIATLAPDAAAGLEIPEGLGALVVPATCAGEPLGVLLVRLRGRARARAAAPCARSPRSGRRSASRSCRSACSPTSRAAAARPRQSPRATRTASSSAASTASRWSRPVIARVLVIDVRSLTSTSRPLRIRSAFIAAMITPSAVESRNVVSRRSRTTALRPPWIAPSSSERRSGRGVEVELAAHGDDQDLVLDRVPDVEPGRHRGGAKVTTRDSPSRDDERTATPSAATASSRARPPWRTSESSDRAVPCSRPHADSCRPSPPRSTRAASVIRSPGRESAIASSMSAMSLMRSTGRLVRGGERPDRAHEHRGRQRAAADAEPHPGRPEVGARGLGLAHAAADRRKTMRTSVAPSSASANSTASASAPISGSPSPRPGLSGRGRMPAPQSRTTNCRSSGVT